MKKPPRPNSINVLAPEEAGRQLWQFSADGGSPELEASLRLAPAQPAPPGIAGKNWMTLWQPRVNIAWLPADQVFLRVVQVPQADASEIASMLEFQLEKLSPLPVAQIVWSFELIASREINNVTALVIIVSRDAIEEKLGALEAGGYQPDRLELPHVYQLTFDIPEGDGVWIYPWSEGGREFAIAAWWFTGSLRNLQLIHLPTAGDRADLLKDQLLKTAWAGEMEGWLNFPIRWRVAIPAGATEDWRSIFENWTEGTVEITEQPPREKLAEFAARRTARGEPAANLLPTEFSARYRQQFIDRLWMRAIGAVITLWIVIVIGYFAAVQFLRFRVRGVESKIAGISQTYTNTLRMKERVQILQDQVNLKYAALDSLKTASDLLPTEVTLHSLVLSRGPVLELRGASETAKAIADYNDAVRNATVNGRPVFKNVLPPTSSAAGQGGGFSWAFNAELNREEIQ